MQDLILRINMYKNTKVLKPTFFITYYQCYTVSLRADVSYFLRKEVGGLHAGYYTVKNMKLKSISMLCSSKIKYYNYYNAIYYIL